MTLGRARVDGVIPKNPRFHQRVEGSLSRILRPGYRCRDELSVPFAFLVAHDLRRLRIESAALYGLPAPCAGTCGVSFFKKNS